MSVSRKRTMAAAVLAIVVGVTVGAAQTSRLDDIRTEVLGKQIEKKGPVIDASCDIDGVTVGYDASYAATPAPAGYRVPRVTIGGVAATCLGAEVEVELLDAVNGLASGTATVNGASVVVTIGSPPPARDVMNVRVTIAGGTTPVPPECATIVFDQFLSLTAGNDSHVGTKGNDLVYGLAGNDSLRGGNKDDCLVGQAGNDTLFGENQADVLIGGDGDDVLDGGSGDDVLIGGPGHDICRGGPGKNTYDGCEVRS